MNNISYADIVSSFALFIAAGALAWNIIRDLVMDKVAIEFSIIFGERGNIRDSKTGLFASAGSFPNHQFDNPGMLVKIINIGRRPVGVSKVGGKFRDGKQFFMAVDGLPKMLQPYEIFSSISDAKRKFLENIKKDEVECLWATDTKGKKWLLPSEKQFLLKDTANYIVLNKHMP